MIRDEEAIRDFKEECRHEAMEEEREAERLHNDIDYAMEEFGLLGIMADIANISKCLYEHGHEMSVADICDYIKDM